MRPKAISVSLMCGTDEKGEARMLAKKTDFRRALASLVAVLVLVAGAPPAALAESDGIWTQWANRVTDRESKAEVPLAILVSLPAMLIITPIWLGKLAIEKLSGGDDED
jgi:hypothetical protein